jgi:hypothetical protein
MFESDIFKDAYTLQRQQQQQQRQQQHQQQQHQQQQQQQQHVASSPCDHSIGCWLDQLCPAASSRFLLSLAGSFDLAGICHPHHVIVVICRAHLVGICHPHLAGSLLACGIRWESAIHTIFWISMLSGGNLPSSPGGNLPSTPIGNPTSSGAAAAPSGRAPSV